MRRPLIELPKIAPRRRRTYLVGDDGRISVDPAARHVKPYWLTTFPAVVPVPAADDLGLSVLAGGTSFVTVPLVIDDKGPMEVIYSYFEARFTEGASQGQPATDFTISMFDPDMRLVLMNREIHATTMAGGFGDPLGAGFLSAAASAGGRPLVWPETFFIEPKEGAALHVGFRNLSTDAIEVRFVLAGVRYYDSEPYEQARREKEEMYGDGRVSYPYFFSTDKFVLLEANGSPGDRGRFPMRIGDDTDLEIYKMTKFSDADFLWRIFEKDSGNRALDNAGQDTVAETGVHSDLGWGSGEFPFIPFETAYYEATAKLDLLFINLDGQNRNRIFPTFISRRIGHVPEWW